MIIHLACAGWHSMRLSGRREIMMQIIKERHMVPFNDLREHETDHHCWCSPRKDDGFIIHNSMAGRGFFESAAMETLIRVASVPLVWALAALIGYWFAAIVIGDITAPLTMLGIPK